MAVSALVVEPSAMAVIECIPNISEGRRQDVLDACAGAIRRGRRPAARRQAGRVAQPHRLHVRRRRRPGQRGRRWRCSTRAIARHRPAAALRRAPAHRRRRRRAVRADRGRDDGRLRRAGARGRGAKSSSEHDLPVFLYEEAAPTPARRNLEDIRRGEFEGLAAKMQQPEWAPDFGPAHPHPSAGASVIGARMPLIAYNINLATNRLDVAKKIAAAVRQSSGGLRYVKAMGVDARRSRHRAGVDEPDQLREDADLPGLRAGQARGRALRRGRARKRDRRPRSRRGADGVGRLVSADSTAFTRRSDPREQAAERSS